MQTILEIKKVEKKRENKKGKKRRLKKERPTLETGADQYKNVTK